MTCVVVALSRGRAHLFADTAHLGPTGALWYSSSKIMTFARGHFAVATRGSAIHKGVVGALAWRHRSYAEARARLPRTLGGPLGRLLSLFGAFEAYAAGIDDSGAPAAFVLVSHRLHDRVEPWTAYDVAAVSTGPSPDLDPGEDPLAFGVRAAELQRGVLQRLPFARSPVSIVGGALQHVEIGPGGVRTETLGGWFDRLGDKLNPAAAFSRSGGKVRKAKRPNLAAWLLPRTPWAMLRNFLIAWSVFAAARLVVMAPAVIYVEQTYHGAPTASVETAAGSWDAWLRLDAGRLITSPTTGRGAAAAAAGRRSTAADHAEAARLALLNAGRRCSILASREVLPDEYEHEIACP